MPLKNDTRSHHRFCENLNLQQALHKTQAAGNDFLILPLDSPLPSPDLCQSLSCRRRSIGCDGIIHFSVAKAKTPDLPPLVLMRFFNADGSQVGMCGNALRALTMHLISTGLVSGKTLAITLSAVLFDKAQQESLSQELFEREFIQCTVMGQERDPAHPFGEHVFLVQSIFPCAANIPLKYSSKKLELLIQEHFQKHLPRTKPNISFEIDCAHSGVEHLVITIKRNNHQQPLDLHSIALESLAQKIRENTFFQKDLINGCNISFLQKADADFTSTSNDYSSKCTYNIRTFERGVFEETWSCTSAIVAAATCMMSDGEKALFNFTLKQQKIEIKKDKDALHLLGPAQSCYYVYQTPSLSCIDEKGSGNIFANKGRL